MCVWGEKQVSSTRSLSFSLVCQKTTYTLCDAGSRRSTNPERNVPPFSLPWPIKAWAARSHSRLAIVACFFVVEGGPCRAVV